MTSSLPIEEPRSFDRDGTPRLTVVLAILLGLSPFLLAIDQLGWPPGSHMYAYSQKVREGNVRLANRTDGPRVFFIGGSNIIHGIEAPSLSERIGRQVVPFGINAGIGVDVIAEGVEPLVRRNDIIVLAPELHNLRPQYPWDKTFRTDWMYYNNSTIDDPAARFPHRQWSVFGQRARTFRRKTEFVARREIVRFIARTRGDEAMSSWPPNDPQQLDTIDDDGLHIAKRPTPIPVAAWNRQFLPSFNLTPGKTVYDFDDNRLMYAIDRLKPICDERGATLMVMPAFRVTPPKYGPGARKGITEVERRWLDAARARDVHALLGPGETEVSHELGFNTVWHLNDHGVAVMEDKLVPALLDVIAGQPPESD